MQKRAEKRVLKTFYDVWLGSLGIICFSQCANVQAHGGGAIPRLALSKSERFVAVTSGPAVELPTATISKYPNTLSLSLSLGPLTLIGARSSVAEGQTARSRAAPAGGSRDGARAGTAARASPEQHVGFARESCRRRGAWWLAGRKG